MSFFNIFGSIFEKWPMTDLTNIIVSKCLVSYNFCMIPRVLTVTFELNLSGAWGEVLRTDYHTTFRPIEVRLRRTTNIFSNGEESTRINFKHGLLISSILQSPASEMYPLISPPETPSFLENNKKLGVSGGKNSEI